MAVDWFDCGKEQGSMEGCSATAGGVMLPFVGVLADVVLILPCASAPEMERE